MERNIVKSEREELTKIKYNTETLINSIKNNNDQVSFLVNYLEDLKAVHCYEIYQVLSKIMEIRKSQMTNYRISDLSNEKGIPLTSRRIYYYMNFKFMSQKTKERIDNGLIKYSTFLFLVNRCKIFRESYNQNNIFSKLEKKEITLEEIGTKTKYELLHQLGREINTEQKEKIVSILCSSINRIRLRIKDQDKDISLCVNKSDLKVEIQKLNDAVTDVLSSVENGLKKEKDG